MDRKRVIYILGIAAYCLAFLALYVLIYVKVGRAETFDEFEIVTRAQNLIYEETPAKPSDKNKASDPDDSEKLQYAPTLQVPTALMNEEPAPAATENGALYGAGRDVYVNPAVAKPETSSAPILEDGAVPAKAGGQ